jgi:TolA-binding protein
MNCFQVKVAAHLFLLLGVIPFVSACAHQSERFYFGNYSQAENFYNKGEFERAIQKYQAYIDENPEGNLAVIAAYYMARSHAALGHKEEARVLFEGIIKNHPQVVWANFSETQLKELESVTPSNPAAQS